MLQCYQNRKIKITAYYSFYASETKNVFIMNFTQNFIVVLYIKYYYLNLFMCYRPKQKYEIVYFQHRNKSISEPNKELGNVPPILFLS